MKTKQQPTMVFDDACASMSEQALSDKFNEISHEMHTARADLTQERADELVRKILPVVCQLGVVRTGRPVPGAFGRRSNCAEYVENARHFVFFRTQALARYDKKFKTAFRSYGWCGTPCSATKVADFKVHGEDVAITRL